MADDLGFVSTADHSDLGFEPHQKQTTQQQSSPGLLERALGVLHSLPNINNIFPQGIRGSDGVYRQPNVDYGPLDMLVMGGLTPTEVPPLGTAVEASRAMTKGAAAAAKAAPISKTGATVGGGVGYGVGQSMGHPILGTEIGAAVGGAVPKAKAAVKGAGQALKDFRKPSPPPPIDYTMGGSEMAIPGVGPRPPAPPPSVAAPEGWTGAPTARGPVTPVEPLNVGGPMPPPVEGTLQPPKPPAPLPPPPKLLPTAAERDAMAAGKMMEQRIAKDVKLAQYFKDQGLDAAAVRKLSDTEFNAHLRANKMRAASKSPSGLHRSLDEIREHIASRLEGRPY